VQVDGRRVVWWERGSGPAVLFLHGWALSPASYRETLERLAAGGARVLAPALPGFGDSAELPEPQVSLGGYAAHLAAWLDVIGVTEQVTVVGHSFGGGVAIRLAHDHPRRVDRLVLVNSIGGAVWAADDSGSRLMSERPWWDWGLHLQADLSPARQAGRVLPVVLADAATNALRHPLAVWRVAELARTADLRAELEELARRQLPVIVLWGRRDQVLPAASLAAIRLALGDPTVYVVEGSHSWLLSDPAAFTEVMTNVLAGEGALVPQAPVGDPDLRDPGALDPGALEPGA
jgi:pimeloyl-ACP methyl ester carboxylesterase